MCVWVCLPGVVYVSVYISVCKGLCGAGFVSVCVFVEEAAAEPEGPALV